jgi:hypothetical protein
MKKSFDRRMCHEVEDQDASGFQSAHQSPCEARGGFAAGLQRVPLAGIDRQRSYELELEAFLPAVRGERPPDRSLDHELLVQETLLRATGRISNPA